MLISTQELREYFRLFNDESGNLSREKVRFRARELLEQTKKVMGNYTSGEKGSKLQGYYSGIVEKLETAFSRKDFSSNDDGFVGSLDLLIQLIEKE